MQDKEKNSLKEETKKYSYNYFINKPDMKITMIDDKKIMQLIKTQGKQLKKLSPNGNGKKSTK